MKFIQITNDLTMVDENHLGGFIIENDPATFTPTLWEYICKKYNITSVVDIGCGMGYAIKEFLKHCNIVTGIDGSLYVKENSSLKDYIIYHDFSKDKFIPEQKYDLSWSSEFLEHVEEKYMNNYMSIFQKTKYCAVTYADIGQSGHYHVNCNNKDYWITKFNEYNFTFLEKDTEELKQKAYADGLLYNPLYKDNHFYNRGLFFKNNNF